MLELLAAAWWPALFAGVVAVAVTVAIERWGGEVGGFLGTLPTTIVPAAIGFFDAAPSVPEFRAALGAVPVALLGNALFLATWRVAPPRMPQWRLPLRLGAMVVLSLAVWGVVAAASGFGLGHLRDLGLETPVVGGVATALLIGLGVAFCLDARLAPPGRRRVGAGALLGRGLLAGAAIGVSVVLADLGSPVLAGVASVFPAIFVTTMVSLWLAQGEAVPLGAVGPMMLGSSSVAVFALIGVVTLPLLGAWAGTAVAWVLAAITVTLPATLWLRRRRQGQRRAP